MILTALTGWASGIVTLAVWSVLWPRVIPLAGGANAMPGSWKVLLVALALITPFALIGGLVGGRLPSEGGRREQILYAALFGALFSLAFGSCAFWYVGW
jgi:hypothetical protein